MGFLKIIYPPAEVRLFLAILVTEYNISNPRFLGWREGVVDPLSRIYRVFEMGLIWHL